MSSITQDTPGKRAMRKDAGFPDVPLNSSGELDLIAGILAELTEAAVRLGHRVRTNRSLLHFDVANDLEDLSQRVLSEIDDVTCMEDDCGRAAIHHWFDGRRCDKHEQIERMKLRAEEPIR